MEFLIVSGLSGVGKSTVMSVLEASGFFARVFQHEIDHLNGILFTDVMIEEVREQAEPAEEPRRKRIVGRKK